EPSASYERQGQTGTAAARPAATKQPARTTAPEPHPPPHRREPRGEEGAERTGRSSRTEMRGGSRPTPAALFLLAAAGICAQFAAVLAGDPKDDKKAEAQPKGHTGKTVLFVLLGVGAVILLSFFIFKYWQKKKREEQHARLLKLFEEDDDIEVELGLRD
ncbi:unnamed protein product, partial [Urochloa humidicola]